MRKAARWAASPSAPRTNISSPARTWTISPSPRSTAPRPRSQSGAFATEIAPVTIKGRKGDTIVDTDEAPGRGMPDKIPTLQARLRQGRHDHRRDQLVDQRRRRRGRPRPPVDRRRQGLHPRRADRRQRGARAKAVRIHHRPDRRDREIAREGRLVGRRRRPVRSQRSLRLRRDVRDEGPRHLARQDQRPRRRHRARPPDRRQRHAHPRHPGQRAQDQGPQARRRQPVHRRRRSHGGGGRTGRERPAQQRIRAYEILVLRRPSTGRTYMHKLVD